jgi:hypothetical protein
MCDYSGVMKKPPFSVKKKNLRARVSLVTYILYKIFVFPHIPRYNFFYSLDGWYLCTVRYRYEPVSSAFKIKFLASLQLTIITITSEFQSTISNRMDKWAQKRLLHNERNPAQKIRIVGTVRGMCTTDTNPTSIEILNTRTYR